VLVHLARDLDELHVPHRHAGHRQPLVHAEPDLVERGAGVGAGPNTRDSRLGVVGSRFSLMFSAIEKPGMSMNSWCTMPSPDAIASRGEPNFTSAPLSTTRPW
jgi:hypothetical protein